MEHTKDTESRKLKHFHCSILIKEMQEKVQMLKGYGMTEEEIISQLFCTQPLPKLMISRNSLVSHFNGTLMRIQI